MKIKVNENGTFAIEKDGKVIGEGSVVENGTTYLEALEIQEEHRNQGYGTEALYELAKIYGEICLAPDNEDAQRLYERIADDMKDSDYNEFGFALDQGYGVYVL